MISSLPGKALRTLVDIARLAKIKRILGECLLISSLSGKDLRTLVEIMRLADRLVSFDIKFTRQGSENACLFARLAEQFDMCSPS